MRAIGEKVDYPRGKPENAKLCVSSAIIYEGGRPFAETGIKKIKRHCLSHGLLRNAVAFCLSKCSNTNLTCKADHAILQSTRFDLQLRKSYFNNVIRLVSWNTTLPL